jgi:hypothetical protein
VVVQAATVCNKEVVASPEAKAETFYPLSKKLSLSAGLQFSKRILNWESMWHYNTALLLQPVALLEIEYKQQDAC